LTDTVLLQVRVNAALLRKVDELCAEGLFKNRSDAVNDALRYLVLRYSRTSLREGDRALPRREAPEVRIAGRDGLPGCEGENGGG